MLRSTAQLMPLLARSSVWCEMARELAIGPAWGAGLLHPTVRCDFPAGLSLRIAFIVAIARSAR